jgi:hypothetical protein
MTLLERPRELEQSVQCGELLDEARASCHSETSGAMMIKIARSGGRRLFW